MGQKEREREKAREGKGVEESERERRTTLGEKKKRERKTRETGEKEMLNFASRQQRCLSDVQEEGVNGRRGGMDDTAGGG